MKITAKKLETWCRQRGFVTSRDGIDFDAAAGALGISRRAIINYLRAEDKKIPPWVGLAMAGYDALHGHARDAA